MKKKQSAYKCPKCGSKNRHKDISGEYVCLGCGMQESDAWM
jgi:transcription initiation factor TFIIIB Brf1 subunit/transcription initiation factor TFIIB